MDKILMDVSVLVLGEIMRSPKYDEDNVEVAVCDAVMYARLLISEINNDKK